MKINNLTNDQIQEGQMCIRDRLLHVASHELRRDIKEGKDISSYLPEAVVSYIKEHRLYL